MRLLNPIALGIILVISVTGRECGNTMKITVCDDSIKDLLDLEKRLLAYQKRYPDKPFELEKYSDPSRLFRKISDGKLTDIYILDMLMPQRTGIDLGRQIRKTGGDNVIIYVTSSEDYALDAYDVHAARYLLKPINENRLFEALDYALSFTKAKTDPTYIVKTKNGLQPIACSKIEYIENAGRKLEVHLSDGSLLKSLFIRTSFEEAIQELVEHKNFSQIHKSFLVNLNYVKQLAPDSVITHSGEQLPVSRAKPQTVKREYLLFVSEHTGR